MKNLTKFRGIITVGVVIMFAFSLAGCATQVPIKSVRPPTIDTSEMQRMAIKPFENRSGASMGTQLAQYLTDQSRQVITTSGKFQIVAPSDPNADGVFTGEVRNVTSNDKRETSEWKDKDGNVHTTITYTRTVSVEFVYGVVDTRTGIDVATLVKSGSTSTSSSEPSQLTDSLSLARRVVDSQLRSLKQDIVPTIVSQNRPLMKETSKDKIVKQRMKTAQALVKNNNYQEAIREYDSISSEHNSAAARVNADLLRQAVESDIAARAELAALFADTDGKAEKASKSVIEVLNAKLPAGSNIVIMKTDSRERDRLDYVMDQMTKTIVQAGVLKVVDRSNQALINAEQQYQLSGNVDDAQIVSIGKQLGVQYIVQCWISGQMSTRRLNFKVLNVETAQITHQDDFEI